VKKGDIVIIHNDIPRACCKLAVIDELIVGKDGLVWAVNIRTSTGITSRPITKLYPMEVNEADDPLESDGTEIPTRKASSILTNAISKIGTCRELRQEEQLTRWRSGFNFFLAPQRMLRQTNCNCRTIILISSVLWHNVSVHMLRSNCGIEYSVCSALESFQASSILGWTWWLAYPLLTRGVFWYYDRYTIYTIVAPLQYQTDILY